MITARNPINAFSTVKICCSGVLSVQAITSFPQRLAAERAFFTCLFGMITSTFGRFNFFVSFVSSSAFVRFRVNVSRINTTNSATALMIPDAIVSGSLFPPTLFAGTAA